MNREFIQYIAKTHTDKNKSKDSAVRNKRNCASQHTLYMKAMSFEEIVEAQDCGLTIGRIYPETSFLVLDIDLASFPYTVIRDIYNDRSDIRSVIETSGNANKFHIYVDLGDKIVSEAEYTDEVHRWHQKIKSDLEIWLNENFIFELDESSDDFWHCFFGTCQDHSYEYVLDDSVRLTRWKRKSDASPMLQEFADTKRAHMSLSSSEYCYLHNLMTVDETERYDIALPSRMGLNKFRIPVGARWKWTGVMCCKLILRAKYLQHQFGESWDIDDIKCTLRHIVAENVELPSEFLSSDDYYSQVNAMERNWSRVKNLTWDMTKSIYGSYFVTKKRRYKVKDYNRVKATELIQSKRSIRKDGTLQIVMRRTELNLWCEENHVRFRWLCEYLKELSIELVLDENYRSDKNRAYNSIVKNAEIDKNGIIIVDNKYMKNRKFRNYCKENHLKVRYLKKT